MVNAGNLEYKTGLEINTTNTIHYYNFSVGDLTETGAIINETQERQAYNYSKFTGNNSHLIGFYLALIGGVGLILTTVGIARTKWD